MEGIDVVAICEKVLSRLCKTGYEKEYLEGGEQLIFPNKRQAKGDVKRISEQELRFLFVEEFKILYPRLYYSIETPTEAKYKFGKSYMDIVENVNTHKVSASLDMCVFEKNSTNYKRLINIEFKHKNTKDKNFAKDVLKLIREEQNGAFIILLNNTKKGNAKGTLRNQYNTGVFDKLNKSFKDFSSNWNGENKYIQLVLLSLSQKKLIHQKITKTDIANLDSIFFAEEGCGTIKEIKGNGWGIIDVEPKLGMVAEENAKYGEG